MGGDGRQPEAKTDGLLVTTSNRMPCTIALNRSRLLSFFTRDSSKYLAAEYYMTVSP